MKSNFIDTDLDSLPVEEARRLPEEDWFTPDPLKREEERQHIQTTAPEHPVLVISDTDADGLGCAAVARTALPDVGYIPAGPHDPVLELSEALTEVAEHLAEDTTVFICDISPNESDWEDIHDAVRSLSENASELIWCDHHNYTSDIQQALNDLATVRIGESETQCATDVLYEYLDETTDTNWPDQITDLVAVTRDRDCWIQDDPRNEDIADYVAVADADTYIETVLEHGPDLTDTAHQEINEYRSSKSILQHHALGNSDIYEFELGEDSDYEVDVFRLAVVYGRCPSSDTAESIRERQDAHVVVMVKPSGAVSLRGSDVFTDCYAIAAAFDGGGHDKAAGCYPPDLLFDSMMDFAAHWQSDGKLVRQAILMEFTNLLDASPVGA